MKEEGKFNSSGIAVITVIVSFTVLSMIIIATDHHYHRRCERALFCVEVFFYAPDIKYHSLIRQQDDRQMKQLNIYINHVRSQ